jgi:DNA replication protein DnaC
MLNNFNFDRVPMVSKAQVMALASNDSWLEQGANLLFFGRHGAGKSHLAAGIGHGLVENGRRVLFIRTKELVQQLQVANRELRLEAAIAKLDKYHLLILDLGEVQSYVEFPNRRKVRNGLWPSKLHITNSGHQSRFSQSITSTAAGDRWPA